MSAVVLYSRPGCHLCDHAREALERAGIAFDEVDITRDPALLADYGTVIPVVERDGLEVFTAGMDPADLPARLAGNHRNP